MKRREGFVSNSSSSSFIICRAQIGDDKFNKLVEFVNSYDDIPDEEKSDYHQDMYPDISKNYISIDTSDVDTERLYNYLKEQGIADDDYASNYG